MNTLSLFFLLAVALGTAFLVSVCVWLLSGRPRTQGAYFSMRAPLAGGMLCFIASLFSAMMSPQDVSPAGELFLLGLLLGALIGLAAMLRACSTPEARMDIRRR